MRSILTISLLACSHAAFSAPKPEVRKPDEVVVYRKTEQAELGIEIFRPKGVESGRYPLRSGLLFRGRLGWGLYHAVSSTGYEAGIPWGSGLLRGLPGPESAQDVSF